MAERRMFAKTIIDSDAFLDMPLSTQALYFHLSMRADDDGFINNPKKISKMLGSSDDELKVLLAKRFILYFDSGVIVIKHWRIHNYIQKDRYKETVYTEEKALLSHKENNGYTLDTECVQIGDTGKVRIELGKDSQEIEIVDRYTNEADFSISKETSYDRLSAEYKKALKVFIEQMGLSLPYQDFVDALQAKGYKYKNFVIAYRNWCKKDYNKGKRTTQYDHMVQDGKISKEVAHGLSILDGINWGKNNDNQTRF